jgi:Plant transposon protein
MIPIPVLICQVLQQLVPVMVQLFKVLEQDSDNDELWHCVTMTQTILDTVDAAMHIGHTIDNAPIARRTVMYNRERARICIYQDYMSPSPLFDDRQFKRMFRVSKAVYATIKASALRHPFFNCRPYEASGRECISLDAKLLIALKHLAYGASHNAFRDYFQMGTSTSFLCFKYLLEVLSTDQHLQQRYFRRMTKEDTHRVLALHKEVHGVPGMLGSVDCLHVYWKNCPYAWQGSFMGKEDGPTVIVEAASDHNLWIWHASVGYPGALNDINVFDLSSLSKKMVDGTLEANDVPFTAGDELRITT